MDIKTFRIIEVNANPQVCTSCGGKCCTRMPGGVLPSDLDARMDSIKIEQAARELLATGRYGIDWLKGKEGPPAPWAGQDRAYFLRPAIQGYESQNFHGSWGGACTFHSASGCALAADDRPGECKLLVPSATGQCHYPSEWAGKLSVAQAWRPYRKMFADLLAEFIAG